MDYASVRLLHIFCAMLSITLFGARALLQWQGVEWRRWRAWRVLPHVNDTVLLAAAAVLAWRSHQYPLQQAWLSAKVLGLLAYIVLGRMALQSQNSPQVRTRSLVVALMCVGYIVAVAHTRSPWVGF